MNFCHQQLDNGLNIIAECNAQAYSTSIAFFVRTGSRDETADIAGVSHFLEHMVFKGTPRRSAADVNRELDELGSHSNAFTSEEQTVYYATVLPEYQDAVVDLLADIMRPSLREEDFDTEKQVIIEEILKYDDQPPFGAHEKSMEAFFGSHPLASSVLGTVESVGGMTPDGMRDYFRQRYSPGNMTLAACGNVDFDALTAQAEKLCGEWAPFAAERDVSPAQANVGKYKIEKESAAQEYSVVISSGPCATDPRRFAARLMAYALGDDSGSRLFWGLVDPGLAEYACSSVYEFDGAGILMSYLCCAPADTEANLARFVEMQNELDANGITEDELELVKSKVCSQIVRRSERPSSRLFSVGNSWLQRRDYKAVKDTLAAYQAVTVRDVNEVLEAFPTSRTMTVSVGPPA